MIEVALCRGAAIQLITTADAAAMQVHPSCLPNALTNRGESSRTEERMQMPAPLEGSGQWSTSSWVGTATTAQPRAYWELGPAAFARGCRKGRFSKAVQLASGRSPPIT